MVSFADVQLSRPLQIGILCLLVQYIISRRSSLNSTFTLFTNTSDSQKHLYQVTLEKIR